MDDVASCGNFKGKDSQPANSVLPAASETPGGVNKATDVHGEGSVDRVHDGQFSESLHHEVAGLAGQIKTKPSNIRETHIMPPRVMLVTTSRF